MNVSLRWQVYAKLQALADVSDEVENNVRGWLRGFIQSMGLATATFLLQGAGTLEPLPGRKP